jgi:PilZ domain
MVEAGRRRGQRATFSGWVELTFGNERRLARSCDLSAHGLGLLLDAPHPPAGTAVESEFALPGFGVPLAVPARVAWSNPDGGRLGLAFDPLDLAVAELLESAVAGRFERG